MVVPGVRQLFQITNSDIPNQSFLMRICDTKSDLNRGRIANKRKFREDEMDIQETIKEQISSNPVLIYMKGSPDQPQCGFSAQATQILMSCGERFAFMTQNRDRVARLLMVRAGERHPRPVSLPDTTRLSTGDAARFRASSNKACDELQPLSLATLSLSFLYPGSCLQKSQ